MLQPFYKCVLELTFSDGNKKRYGTDLKNWKAGIAGPVKHAGIFDGEEYDAREPMGYECVDKLSTPEENTEFSGDILPSDGAEVYLRTDLALAPVKAYVWKNVEEISTMVGFANRQSFYAAFYKNVGETPNGYRKKRAVKSK